MVVHERVSRQQSCPLHIKFTATNKSRVEKRVQNYQELNSQHELLSSAFLPLRTQKLVSLQETCSATLTSIDLSRSSRLSAM